MTEGLIELVQSAEEWAEFYGVPEPESWRDVIRILFEVEGIRGQTFGMLGAFLVVPLVIADRLLRKAPRAFLPAELIPLIVGGIAAFLGVGVAISRWIDVSHGVHMANQALQLYATGHIFARKFGGQAANVSGVFKRGG